MEQDAEDMTTVQKGMHVLVSNLYYRFWVHVAEVSTAHRIIGIICTHLSKYSSYQFGDVIQFKSQNILATITGSEDQTSANTQRNHLA